MKRLFPILAAGFALAFASPAFAASAGDILRADTLGDIYLINTRQSRLTFPDQLTVQSWGSPQAVDVPVSTLARLDLKGAVPLREGSYLVRFGTDPQVYAVSPGGVLHWITTASLAEDLYGSRWNRRVISLYSSFYPNYKMGDPITEAKHPDGTLFKYAGSPTVYYLINGVARPFINEAAFYGNNLSFESVITLRDSQKYIRGNWITGYDRDLHAELQQQ